MHYEENYTQSEEIDNLPLVGQPIKDFRSHVSLCSELSHERTTTIPSLKWRGEAKVNYFNVKVFVKQDIFRL
jgi:hypothetical protein